MSRISCSESILFNWSLSGLLRSISSFAARRSSAAIDSCLSNVALCSLHCFSRVSFFMDFSFSSCAFSNSFSSLSISEISSGVSNCRAFFFSSTILSSFSALVYLLYIRAEISLYIPVSVSVCSIIALSFSSALRKAAKFPCASNTARLNCSYVNPMSSCTLFLYSVICNVSVSWV